VITCPIRFREDWRIIEDAARFFFPSGGRFTSLSEVRLRDAEGATAGDIDFVLVSLDDQGNVIDFGALEVQAVYISGNVTNPFKHYMEHRRQNPDFDWPRSVRPDYLSSSRKRLVPQLIYKGNILMEWRRKMAVVLQDCFFETFPDLPAVPPEKADIAWFIYGLDYDVNAELCHLIQKDVVYTAFKPALDEITTPRAGDVNDFVAGLQDRLDQERYIYPPINLTLLDLSAEERDE
jgi:hypothetical protein